MKTFEILTDATDTGDLLFHIAKEIQAICEKHKCNRQPDMELLKKNAKATIGELKKRRMASSLLN